MGKVMFMRKDEVHTAPAALVYLTDDSGNVVMATSETENTTEKAEEVK